MTESATDTSGKRHAVTDVVDLTVPVAGDLAVLARLIASTMATRASFDVEEVEDLRLAVDELCVLMVHDHRDGTLALRFVRDDDRLEVSCKYLAVSGGPVKEQSAPTGDGLSERILEAMVDEHGTDQEDGLPRVWLRKRRSRQQF